MESLVIYLILTAGILGLAVIFLQKKRATRQMGVLGNLFNQ